MEYSLSHTCSLRVRYGETDQMGYCYYGNYAQFFEVGRVETMRKLGLSYKKLEEGGVMLPVSEYSVKYLKPAFYDDLLDVKTTISSLNGAVLLFDYELFNQSGDCIALAQTKLIFVDKGSMRPIKAPAIFVELLNKFKK